MKKILSIILSLFICITGTNGYCGDAQNTEYKNIYIVDLDVALKLSKETKQKLILIFSAEWCGHCEHFKQEFPNIKEFDNKIVCIVDSDEEKILTKQFKVKSLPTSIMLNGDGNEISRKIGYEKISYSKWLKESK